VVVREDAVSKALDESVRPVSNDFERFAGFASPKRSERLVPEALLFDVLAASGVVHLA